MKPISPFLVIVCAVPLAAADPDVTFSRDIAPILYEHCADCHRPGQIGPFPLLTFKDAARRSRQIKEITGDRQMPPWHAVQGDYAFKDERRLSDEEIEIIAKWADADAPEGDPKDLPPPPKLTGGWIHGQPDVVIELPEVEIPADGEDVHVDFVAEIPLENRRWLSCIEILPGNASVVHHANIKVDRSGGLSEWRGKPYRREGLMSPIFSTIRSMDPLDPFLGWVPGTTPHYLPEGYGILLDPGANLFLNFHYHPTGKPEKDKTRIGIYFSNSASRETFPMLFGIFDKESPDAHKLDIPAGKKNHEVRISKPLPLDGRVHTVQGHGHFLMTDLDLFAHLPNGESKTLLSIRDWDLNWQERYTFENPPFLPRGTNLEVVAIYDNSADNPQNPNDPPKPVKVGPDSTDEMCGVGLVIIPNDAELLEIPQGGVPYPQNASRLQKFDADGDGRFSKEEFDAIPQRIKILILENARGSLAQTPGGTPPATPEKPTTSGDFRLPAEGIVIPQEMAQVKDRLDTNKDGKLTEEELAAAPAEIQQKIRDRFKELNPPAQTPKDPAPAPDSPQSTPPATPGEKPAPTAPTPPAPTADPAAFRLPDGGVPIPDQMAQIKEKLDTNRDGKLTEEELQAAPEDVQTKVRDFFKKQTPTPAPAQPKSDPQTPPANPSSPEIPDPTAAAPKLPADGLPIPETMVQIRERFDTNRDNRLSPDELAKVPEGIREKLLTTLLERQQPASPTPPRNPSPPNPPSPAQSEPPQPAKITPHS